MKAVTYLVKSAISQEYTSVLRSVWVLGFPLHLFRSGSQTLLIRICATIALIHLVCGSATAYAACTSPAGEAGAITWNGTAVVWCDGTNWVVAGGGGGGLSGGTSGYLGVWSGATSIGLSSTSAGQQLFWNGTNHRLGIGTTTPGYKLEVADTGTMPALVRSTGTTAALLGFADANTAAASAIGAIGQNLTAWTGSSERLRINASGNVGIGTTSPNARLEIAGPSPSIRIKDTAAATASNALAGILSFRDSADAEYGWVGDGSGTSNNMALYSGTGNAQLLTSSGSLTLLSGGNVGIGTTAPGRLLHLLSNSTSASPGVAIESTDTGGRGYEILSTASGSTAGVGKLLFRDITGNANRMVIDGAGNVGIGTTSPQALFHVEKNQAVETSAFVSNSDASGYAALRLGPADRATNGDGMFFAGTTTGIRAGARPFVIQTGSGNPERMRIDQNGNVGIGTSAAGYRFTVSGNSGADIALINTTAGVAYFGAVGSTDLALETNGTQRVRVSSNGNVGIGTLTPTEKLEVNGNIKMGYQQVSCSPGSCAYSGGTTTINCPAGTQVLGGGCDCQDGTNLLRASRPNGSAGWACVCGVSGSGQANAAVYANCANIK